ncbi:peptide chain release factor N(5)-glutamine methyltransferase [Pararobbsia alpina]|uniref:Release factor glutamine methyltransferase n=1 Tax=Pararobbsia alpina TaxID=621374 RepID=A0A6S7BG51_9BURK|nr:peptide chain release factor N(5)-glutamine methyltransferase [Pararobbsia alpina]CAB3797558.1 Release factor glutamine methyltransferase [Pararobbsia alpina]
MSPATPTELLRASPLDALDARVLLTHALGWRRTDLITRGDLRLSEAQIAGFAALEQRRLAGEPVAQITGWREFYGLDFEVTPAVLIPRPETELLVETVLDSLAGLASPAILDLGTGSGAIAIAIAAQRHDARIVATDRCADALAVAQRNARRLLDADRAGGSPEFVEGSWFEALARMTPRQSFDAIVSNPPYIAAGDPHLSEGDLRFEPPGALTDHADGLSALREIVAGARAWLRPGAPLWVEHGYDQAARVQAIFTQYGFSAVESRRDLAGIERITGARS